MLCFYFLPRRLKHDAIYLDGSIADNAGPSGQGVWDKLGGYRRVCEVSDVPEGTMHAVDINSLRLMIVNVGGSLYAVDRICTHETADLSRGFLTGSEVTCPLHLSRFDVRTGTVQNPPAAKPLATYKLKVEGNSVYVEV